MWKITQTVRDKPALTVRTGLYIPRGTALYATALREEQKTAQIWKLQAIRLSHGPLKTKKLQSLAWEVNQGRGLYSTAQPAPPMNPAIINLQTGRLSRSWQTRTTAHKDGPRTTLWNTAPYAYKMLGTARMIPRPILQEVFRLEQQPRLRRLAEAKTRALQQ